MTEQEKQNKQGAYSRALGIETPPNQIKNKNQYDLQREQIRTQGAKERTEGVKQTGAEATQRGFGVGSLMHEGLQKKTDLEARKNEAIRLGGVDMSQLQASEAKEEAEKQRQFQTSERMGSQEFVAGESGLGRELQREFQTQNLTQREKELSQQMTQFNTRLDFEKSALAQGFDENEKNRAWQQVENQRNRTSQEGMAGNQIFSQEMQAKYNRDLQVSLQKTAQDNAIALETMRNAFQTGIINLQNTMDIEKETRTAKVQTAFNSGQADRMRNITKTQDELSAMTPQERASYQAGHAGRDLAEAEKAYDDQIKLRDAKLVNMSPADFSNNMDEYFQAIEDIFAGKDLNRQPTTQKGTAVGQEFFEMTGTTPVRWIWSGDKWVKG